MKMRLRQLAVAGAVGLALSAAVVAHADGDRDHDRARELREHGDIRALNEILRAVNERVPGDVVAVDLVRSGDQWIYRFQVVDSGGRRTIVDVDAGVGKTLRHEGND